MSDGAMQVSGFESPAPDTGIQSGERSVVAREQTEIQAAIISAKKFPRDEAASYVKAMKSFQRPALADASTYSFSRGNAKVSGPSIDCARELARCWGNMRYGIRVVGSTNDEVHIKGFAIDLETNNYVEAEDRFAKLVQRKNAKGVTEWVVPDERNLRELVGRRGSILVRNSILQLLPPDLIDDALKLAKSTMVRVASGELKENRADTIKKLILAFDSVQVNSEMLQKKLGHELDLITDEEFVELKGIWKSIRDGHSRREEHFELAQRVESPANEKLAGLKKAKSDNKTEGGGAPV